MKILRWLRRPRWSLRSLLIAFMLVGPIAGLLSKQLIYFHPEAVRLLGPVTAGQISAIDPPPETEIIERLQKSSAGDDPADFHIWNIMNYWQDSIVHPQRIMPLIGPVVQYEDTYRYLVFGRKGWLPRVEFITIDQSHLHMVQ